MKLDEWTAIGVRWIPGPAHLDPERGMVFDVIAGRAFPEVDARRALKTRGLDAADGLSWIWQVSVAVFDRLVELDG